MNLRRFWWGLGWVLVLAAVVVCLVPGTEVPGAFEMNDKLGHLVGHGALALYFTGLVPWPRWWKIFLFLLLLGIAIEFAQYHMHVGRDGDPRDVLANAVGAGLGLVLGKLGFSRWPEWADRLLGRRRVAE